MDVTDTGAKADVSLDGSHAASPQEAHYSTKWRFWAIMIALAVTSLLIALDGTVVSTALPSIVHDLSGGELYVWVINAYFLTCTAFQPLYGQMANIFGRRYLTLGGVAVFLLGSGICGGSTSMGMLIAGRAVQGVGGAGLTVMIDLLICDLVPLRERGAVMGLVFAVATLGTALGPFIGGVFVANVTWRWVFYINLPVGAMALVLLTLFLQVHYEKETSLGKKLRRIDVVGNVIFALAIIAIQVPLTNAGVTIPWSSWRTILPLVLGIVGLPAFVAFERSPLCREPTLPRQLFGNRTSAAAFALSFIANFLLFWTVYFFPIYFQAVLGSTPTNAGVRLLPLVLFLPLSGILGGAIMAKLGRYQPIHFVSFALMTIALGTFSLLNETSATAMWVCLQLVFAIGNGPTMSTLLPAVQAPLDEADTATATGTWAVLRNFGTICAIAISTAIFNNRSTALAATNISSPAVKASFEGGHAYELATAAFIDSFQGQPALQAEIIGVYTQSLQLVWEVAVAFAGLGFLLVFLEREVSMRTKLETKFGLDEGERKSDGDAAPEEGKSSES